MALFGRKKDDCNRGCDTGHSVAQPQAVQGEGIAVIILGSGCKKCNELEANAKAALMQLGMAATIDHVTDFGQIAAYGVMTTPALVLNKKLVSAGRVLKKDEIIALIQSCIT